MPVVVNVLLRVLLWHASSPQPPAGGGPEPLFPQGRPWGMLHPQPATARGLVVPADGAFRFRAALEKSTLFVLRARGVPAAEAPRLYVVSAQYNLHGSYTVNAGTSNVANRALLGDPTCAPHLERFRADLHSFTIEPPTGLASYAVYNRSPLGRLLWSCFDVVSIHEPVLVPWAPYPPLLRWE